MEVILKEDVNNLGFKDDIVVVKNGYGRNYLIPKGFAVIATNAEKKKLSENLKQRVQKEKEILKEADKIAKKISKIEVIIASKVGTGNKLFGSVNSQNIVDFFNEKKIELNKNQISLPGKNIKSLGKYEAKIRLHRDLIISQNFEVVPQNRAKIYFILFPMKYSRLSKEQFNLLNKEFSNYLATLSIDKLKWNLLKKNKVNVDKILDDFSDLVWDKVISEKVYLIHFSKKQVFFSYVI